MIAITEKLIPINTKRRPGLVLKGVYFLTAHDTANSGSTADGNVSYFINSANEMEASAHYFVDDKEIICAIPPEEKAWHVRYVSVKDNEIYGRDANDWALSIELCYGGAIDNQKAYQNYVELHAFLCKKYNINPEQRIVGHYALDPIRRNDPLTALKTVNKTWSDFIQDVSNLISKPDTNTNSVEVEKCRKELEENRNLLARMWKYIIELISKK